jgi:hypothetical protein
MRKSRAAWMGQGAFGLMVHWLSERTPQQFKHKVKGHDDVVNRFDLDGFLDGFRRSGADWLVFTLGQNTGYYASPNSILDHLAGPGYASQRDLILEIAQGVKKLGRRFIAYVPAGVGHTPEATRQAFDWKKRGPMDKGQRRYTEFIAEYSQRFGPLLDGWWFDGFYHNHPAHTNLPLYSKLWLDAARAGNPKRAVAFNDASFAASLTLPPMPDQDYLAGETWFLDRATGKVLLQPGWKVSKKPLRLLTPATHTPKPPSNCIWHALVPIDCMWETGIDFNPCQNPPFAWVPPKPHQIETPLYTVDAMENLVRDFKSVGGGVTFNIGIFQEGVLGPATIDRLAELAKRV